MNQEQKHLMQTAKQHFKSWTKGILSPGASRAAKVSTRFDFTPNGLPRVVLGLPDGSKGPWLELVYIGNSWGLPPTLGEVLDGAMTGRVKDPPVYIHR